jgi:hypothetical protein
MIKTSALILLLVLATHSSAAGEQLVLGAPELVSRESYLQSEVSQEGSGSSSAQKKKAYESKGGSSLSK